MEQAGVTRESPTLIRSYKKESEFQIWKQRPDGRYVYLKTFPMCRWSGQLGPKVREGDRQAPEGFYSITPGQMNPNSSYYLSFNVGYPNAYDRALGPWRRLHHGAWRLLLGRLLLDDRPSDLRDLRDPAHLLQQWPARHSDAVLSVQDDGGKSRQASPRPAYRLLEAAQERLGSFRDRLARADGRRLRTALCVRRRARGGHSLDGGAPCPALRRDPQIESLVAEKSAKDDAKIAELVAAGVKPVRVVYQDGGQHPDFTARIAEVSRPDALAAPPTEILSRRSPPKGRSGSPQPNLLSSPWPRPKLRASSRRTPRRRRPSAAAPAAIPGATAETELEIDQARRPRRRRRRDRRIVRAAQGGGGAAAAAPVSTVAKSEGAGARRRQAARACRAAPS